jgi:transposase
MKFVYFSPDPFTTETAIKAHNYAFQYFGGRPQTILYDLDRVYVVSENLGNIIFVPAFEEYVKRIGYSVSLCRPRDPQSKGYVKTFVM